LNLEVLHEFAQLTVKLAPLLRSILVKNSLRGVEKNLLEVVKLSLLMLVSELQLIDALLQHLNLIGQVVGLDWHANLPRDPRHRINIVKLTSQV